MNENQIVEVINRVLNISLDSSTTPNDKHLKSLGIDSLDFFNVLVELEMITGKTVTDEQAENLKTISSLSKYFS